jgi:hypothetical protein
MRLIARSNGSEAIVRPLLTPQFSLREEIAFAPATFDVAGGAGSTDERRDDQSPLRGLAARTLERIGQSSSDERLRGRPPATAPRSNAPSDGRELLPPERATSAQPTTIAAQDARPPLDSENTEPEHSGDRSFQRTLPAPADDRAAAPLGATFRTPPPEHRPEPIGAAPPPLAGEFDSAPVIRIAIGRIEVRANLPRSAPAAAANPPAARPSRRAGAAPKLTLEDYLHRGEARR